MCLFLSQELLIFFGSFSRVILYCFVNNVAAENVTSNFLKNVSPEVAKNVACFGGNHISSDLISVVDSLSLEPVHEH